MVSPKPVSLTQVDAEDYDGAFEPQPLIVVGPIPGGGGGGGAVNSVNGKTGTVVLNAGDVGAAPVNHTQAISTVTGLTDALAAKASTADLDNTFGIAQEAHTIADQANALASTAVQPAALASYVPTSRTVAGKALSANVTLVKADVGLGNVDNTSDATKPISTPQQTALDGKVPTSRTVAGYALTANVPRAGLNTVGVNEAVYIAKNGTVPVGTPIYTTVIEME